MSGLYVLKNARGEYIAHDVIGERFYATNDINEAEIMTKSSADFRVRIHPGFTAISVKLVELEECQV